LGFVSVGGGRATVSTAGLAQLAMAMAVALTAVL
jgi:hypothetical protein